MKKTGEDYFQFWVGMQTVLPKLAKHILDALVIPASSALVEQSFLYSNNFKTDKRSLLSTEHLDDVLQVYYSDKLNKSI